MTDNTTDETTDSPFPGRGESPDIDLSDRPYAIYRCQDCRNTVLSMQDCDGGMTCHGEPMERVTDTQMSVEPPDLREVLLDAFGLPKMGLDICLCVIGDGPLSPKEAADKLGYNESTIRTYLNELADIGLLQKSQLNREGGGFVTVYHSIDLDEMRRETLTGFYVWAGEAAALIEQANLTKEDYMNEDYAEGLEEVFWERFLHSRADGDAG
jgi:predicted transcriptional regulator